MERNQNEMHRRYDADELRRYHDDRAAIELLPLSERKENKVEFQDLFNGDYDILFERISWLLNGSFGYGAQLAFKRLSTRMNRNAHLFTAIAALEWQCPKQYAAKVWNDLSPTKQAKINCKIAAMIAEFDELHND